MSRLREGRANTARGAAHFLRETVGRVRYGGATAQLTVRADSGFYGHTVVSACREMDVRFSITVRQHASLRDLIEAIPEEDWTPIPYWMDGAADVAETTYTPTSSRRPRCWARVAERSSPALATRRWSSKTMRMRSGLFGGSIYWVLLVSGRVSVPKPLSQIQRSTLCLLQGLSPRPSLGGFGGLDARCSLAARRVSSTATRTAWNW